MTVKETPPYVPARPAGNLWAHMPGLDRAAAGHLLQKLPLVRAVLNGARAEIACFHIDIRGRKRRYSCTLWRGNPEHGFIIGDSAGDVTATTLSEICGAMAPLARDLAARWPERARPAIIGIATDGHRILFNAEHPSCSGQAWLSQHLSGRSPCALIADDGKGGVLARICS